MKVPSILRHGILIAAFLPPPSPAFGIQRTVPKNRLQPLFTSIAYSGVTMRTFSTSTNNEATNEPPEKDPTEDPKQVIFFYDGGCGV